MEWEETSLTHLPRGWSRVRREVAVFLRSIGLGIIVASYEGAFNKDFTEPKKTAIRQNRSTALLKSLIHVLPIGFALFEIVTNLHGQYIGETFSKQSYYQIVAKVHEILIEASLASIVLSFVRAKVTDTEGLPYGAFLGGLEFLSVSYLWSRELWSSVFTTSCRLRTRLSFLLLMITCGILAATAGPSSATLLIPRVLLWNLPASYSVVNGSSLEIWPDNLDISHIAEQCLFLNGTSNDPSCLAASWQGIHDQIAAEVSYQGDDFNKPDSLNNGAGYAIPTASNVFVNGQYDVCPFKDSLGQGSQICGGPQSNILVAAAFSDSYSLESQKPTYLDFYHSVDQSIYGAYSAIRCSSDAIIGSEDKSSLTFPRLSNTPQEYQDPVVEVALDAPKKSDLYSKIHGNSSEYRMLWIDLPESSFGQRVTGAILLDPRGSDPASSQNITTCTIAAGWGTSAMLKDHSNLLVVYTFPASLPPSFDDIQITSELGTGAAFQFALFANISSFSFPQRRIQLSTDWLGFLNPTIGQSDGTNTTAINSYMSLLPQQSKELGVAKVLTIMISVGLSTVGQDLAWESKY